MLVVGGGNEGLKKVNALLTQDCKIVVISDEANKEIERYVKQKKITFKKTKLQNANFIKKKLTF